eukprot:2930767-Rhodomonas_salina.1
MTSPSSTCTPSVATRSVSSTTVPCCECSPTTSLFLARWELLRSRSDSTAWPRGLPSMPCGRTRRTCQA